MPTPQLRILGASYGLADYTETIADLVQAGGLHLDSPGAQLIDSWPGHRKSLSVVYQYGSEQPKVLVVADDQQVTIGYVQGPAQPSSADATALRILGATYGLADVTVQVSGLVQNNSAQFAASNATFPDKWEGVVKTCTVVFQYGDGAPVTRTYLEGQPVRLLPWSNYAVQLTGTEQLCAAPSATFYAQDSGELTMEAWVRPSGPGPVVSFVSEAAYETLGFGIGIGGVLVLSSIWGAHGESRGALLAWTPATAVLDGDWHHIAVARRTNGLDLLLDGEPQKVLLDPPLAPQSRPLPLGASLQLNLGYQPVLNGLPFAPRSAYDFGSRTLVGELDEVRLWTSAISPAVIAQRMHQHLAGDEDSLVGYWTFDVETLEDSSPTAAALTSHTTPSYVPSGVDIEPPGSPYLVTQVQLMQDWVPDSTQPTGFREVDGYRVVVAARDPDGNPVPTTTGSDGNPAPLSFSICAADPAEPVWVYYLNGDSDYLGGGVVTRDANSRGEVSFVINALAPNGARVDNPLVCPLVKVSAPFMADGEWLIVAPDAHAHATLAQITGAQLTGQAPLATGETSPLLTQPISTDGANNLAEAIRHVMSTAVDHTLQPNHPVTRKRDDPTDTALPAPYLPLYENLQALRAPYDSGSNAVATPLLTGDPDGTQLLARVLTAESMPAAYWQLTLPAAASSTAAMAADVGTPPSPLFTSLSLAQSTVVVNGFATIEPVDQGLATVFLRQVRAEFATAQIITADAIAELPSQKRTSSGLSLWDLAETASSIVIRTIEQVATDTGQVIKGIGVYVIDAAKNAVFAVLQTVDHAVRLVGALLARFGADVIATVKFIRALFDWNDMRVTARVLQSAFTQLATLCTGAVTTFEATVDTKLAELQAAIGDLFDRWLAAVAGQPIEDQTSPVANRPPQDIRSRYLTSLFADNVAASDPSANSGLTGDLMSAADIATWQQQFPDATCSALVDSTKAMKLPEFFGSPEAFVNAALGKLLAGAKDVVVGAVGLIRTVAHTLFEVLGRAIQACLTLATTPIVIPVVTPFIEQVVFGDGTKLSLASLVCMAASIPFTVVAKLASGSNDPVFTDADVDTIDDPNWEGWAQTRSAIQSIFGTPSTDAVTADATAGPPSKLRSLVQAALGYAYAVATEIWGVCCVIDDMLPPAPIVKRIRLAAQVITDVVGVPSLAMPLGAQHSQRARDITWWIWFGALAALFVDIMASLFVLTMDAVAGVLTGAYGVLQLIGYWVISVSIAVKSQWIAGAVDLAIGYGEALEWIPQLIKPVAEYVPEAITRTLCLKGLLPAMEAEGYAIVVVGTYVVTTEQLVAQIHHWK